MKRALVLFAVLLLLFTPPAFGGVPELNVNRQFGQFSSWLKRATNSAFAARLSMSAPGLIHRRRGRCSSGANCAPISWPAKRT